MAAVNAGGVLDITHAQPKPLGFGLLNPPQRFHAGILRRLAHPHLLDDQERAQVVEIRLAPPGRARGTNIVVHVKAGAENVASPPH